MANGVKTEKRPISDTICCTNVVAVFGPPDHFAAAAACRAESAGHELADGRRSRQLPGTKLFEGLRNPGGWHDVVSIRNVALSDDLPFGMYHLGELGLTATGWPAGTFSLDVDVVPHRAPL